MGGEEEEENWAAAIAIGTPRDLCTAVSTGAAGGGGCGIGDASFNVFDSRDAADQFDLTPRSISHQHQHQHQGGGGSGGGGGGGAPNWNGNSRAAYWGAEGLGIGGSGSAGGSGGGDGGGRAGTTALDTIVTSFLRNQHERCPDPVCVLPPLSLSEPHRCPGRTPAGALGAGAPPNVTKRVLARQVRRVVLELVVLCVCLFVLILRRIGKTKG